MLNAKNIMRIDFVSSIGNVEFPYTILYNQTRISEEHVIELIKNGTWEFDDRLIRIPTSQMKCLEDKEVI